MFLNSSEFFFFFFFFCVNEQASFEGTDTYELLCDKLKEMKEMMRQ